MEDKLILMMNTCEAPSLQFHSSATRPPMLMTKAMYKITNTLDKEFRRKMERKLIVPMNNAEMLMPQFDEVLIPVRMSMMKVTSTPKNNARTKFQRKQEQKAGAEICNS
jgi:hypothetical protein